MTRRELFGVPLAAAVAGLTTSFAGAQEADSYPLTSLTALFANPEKFDGKRVRVIGCLGGLATPEGVQLALFLTRDCQVNTVVTNAVVMEGEYKKFEPASGNYVIFNATFRARPGHPTFTGIQNLKPWGRDTTLAS